MLCRKGRKIVTCVEVLKSQRLRETLRKALVRFNRIKVSDLSKRKQVFQPLQRDIQWLHRCAGCWNETFSGYMVVPATGMRHSVVTQVCRPLERDTQWLHRYAAHWNVIFSG
jgi:hypothetical protein